MMEVSLNRVLRWLLQEAISMNPMPLPFALPPSPLPYCSISVTSEVLTATSASHFCSKDQDALGVSPPPPAALFTRLLRGWRARGQGHSEPFLGVWGNLWPSPTTREPPTSCGTKELIWMIRSTE